MEINVLWILDSSDEEYTHWYSKFWVNENHSWTSRLADKSKSMWISMGKALVLRLPASGRYLNERQSAGQPESILWMIVRIDLQKAGNFINQI